jgi:hypothetical protein
MLTAAILLLPAALGKTWEHYLVRLPNPVQVCDAGNPFIVVMGQSQAANSGMARHFGATGAQMMSEGVCRSLRDPIAGATSSGSSIWPAFSKAFGRPVTLANGAVSGSSIEEWTDAKSAARLRVQDQIRLASRQGIRPALVIWMQGETNAAKQASAGAYARQLVRLKRQIGLDVPWLIIRESRCGSAPPPASREIDEGRVIVARQDRRVVLGPTLDDLGMVFRHDGCHFNPTGQEVVGARLAEAVHSII